jgi:hypothetical protein
MHVPTWSWLGGVQTGDQTPVPLSQLPSVRIGLTYPAQLEVGETKTITLRVTRPETDGVGTAPPTVGVVSLVGSPTPIGTPGVPLRLARGPNYAASLIPSFRTASDMRIEQNTPSEAEQSLDRDELQWEWYAVGHTVGIHRIRFTLEVGFRPNTTDVPPVSKERIWDPEINIEVRRKDALTAGPVEIPVGTLALAAVQVGVTSQVPLVIGWFRGKLKRQTPATVRRRKRR